MVLPGPGTVYSKGRRSCLTSAGFGSVDPCVPVACPESSPSLEARWNMEVRERCLPRNHPVRELRVLACCCFFFLPTLTSFSDFDLALGPHLRFSPGVC